MQHLDLHIFSNFLKKIELKQQNFVLYFFAYFYIQNDFTSQFIYI